MCKGMGKYYAEYKRNATRYLREVGIKGSSWRYMEELEQRMPKLAKEYFDFMPCESATYGADATK